MGSQNSFYYFVIRLIKCNEFDSYEKTDNHFVSYNNKILQKTTISAKNIMTNAIIGAFYLTCTTINPFNRKTLVFQGYVGSSFALNIFINI